MLNDLEIMKALKREFEDMNVTIDFLPVCHCLKFT